MLKQVLSSPLTIVTIGALGVFIYLGFVLSSSIYDDFDYGIHYARAQAQYNYWTPAHANEMIQRSFMTFLPSFLIPIVIIAGVTVILLVVQRRLRS